MEVDILDYLKEEDIIIGLKGKNKKNIINYLIEHLVKQGKLTKECKREVIRAIIQREEMGSTAIGGNIALPHARLDCIERLIVCMGIAKNGVDFAALDDQSVNVIAMILSNKKEAGIHLKLLSSLAKLLRDKLLINNLKDTNSPKEVISLISRQQKVIR